jgi:hypothetical protein
MIGHVDNTNCGALPIAAQGRTTDRQSCHVLLKVDALAFILERELVVLCGRGDKSMGTTQPPLQALVYNESRLSLADSHQSRKNLPATKAG